MRAVPRLLEVAGRMHPGKLMSHVAELLGEDAQGRAALYERSWKEAMMMLRPTEFSVVCNRRHGTVELLPRAKVRRFGGAAADYFRTIY